MAKLDHLGLSVVNLAATRDWYASVLGLEVEFDSGRAAGLRDESDFTLILAQDDGPITKCYLYFQVQDVEVSYREISSRGVSFSYPPQVNDWGYGAGLTDPDGRPVGLWDEKSMREHNSPD